MTKQPEELRLADALTQVATDLRVLFQKQYDLHHQELMDAFYYHGLEDALKEIASETYDEWTNGAKAQRIAQAALAKRQG